MDAARARAWCSPDDRRFYRCRPGRPSKDRTVYRAPGNLNQHNARAAAKHVSDVLPLARTHELSGYDAAYLELSIRYGASLATLDVKVQRAAEAAGITLFVGKAPN
jgi:hypothetical protein